MSYRRLPFEQYFIDNSADYNHTGMASRPIIYTAVAYQCNLFERLFGFHHEVNYDIFYDNGRNVIQINFQQTMGFSDWCANVLEFGSRYYDAIDYGSGKLQLRAHHGWAAMYKSIKYDLRDRWNMLHQEYPDAPTEIIGWSLGSGQAILCAQDLYYNFGLKAYLYTYGSVNPFRYTRKNRRKMEKYLSEIYTECYNFSNVNDIVTYMPPFYGFTMPRRVDVGTDLKRTLFRLLDPLRYHTIYDHASLYAAFENSSEQEG
jgi:hypothetical protein